MPQKGVIQPRLGMGRGGTLPSSTDIPWAMTEFSNYVLVNYASAKNSSSYGLGTNDSPLIPFSGGPYNPVDAPTSLEAGRMKFGQAAGYLHFCTTAGPKTLETPIGTPRSAGLLRMPDLTASLNSNTAFGGTSNWLPSGLSVAYRSLLRKPTSSGVSLLSPPSGRSVVGNAIVAPVGSMSRSGTNTVTVTFPGSANPGLLTGDSFTLAPGEADFPAGTYVVLSDAANVITYDDASTATGLNTVAQTFDIGAASTSMFIYLSEDATVDTPVRLYRSLAAISPSDELFLVDEMFPTVGNIAAGYIPYDDVTPESVLGDPLYTNPQTGEGAAQENGQPPVYRDVASWSERLWYSNTTGQQTLRLEMLGVESPNGVQDGDTLTIGVQTFTFKNTVAVATDVQIVSNGTPSFNIQRTTQNLVRAITSVMDFAGTPIRAYADSVADGPQGKVLLQTVDYAEAAFGVTASRPESWSPALSSSVDVLSDSERVPHGLQYSKLAQPEAVAPVNFLTVGARNYPIKRILALQNALLVFKAGDGIYALTGTFPFQVQQISVANIISGDCAAVFADAAWAYTDQGILRVSDSGGSLVVSRQIETVLNELYDLSTTRLSAYGFAVPYETERRIHFYVPNGDETLSNGLPEMIAYAYNNATQAWTGPLTPNAFCGVVSPSQNKLFLGEYDEIFSTGRVLRENKTGRIVDYADQSFTASISEIDVGGNPLVIRFADSTGIEAGDGVTQSTWGTRIASERTDLGARYFELYESVPFTVASCSVSKHYDVVVQFQPMGNPSARKTLKALAWAFKPGWFNNVGGVTLLATDQVQADLEMATPSPGFGSTPFGVGPFGDPSPMVVDVNPIKAKWVNAAQYFVGFSLSEVWSRFKMQGVVLQLEQASGPVARGGRP